MYETYYDKLQLYFGDWKYSICITCDTDSIRISALKQNDTLSKTYNNLEDIFDFSSLDENHELC